MSNLIEIIASIRSVGGSITSDGGEITISAPAGAISDEDRLVLAENRSTLIAILPHGADHDHGDHGVHDHGDLGVHNHGDLGVDHEREAIRWADTPAADGALDQARREWGEIVDDSVFDQIERVIEGTFADGGIEVSAKFDRAPEPILVETVHDGYWTQPGRGSFTIPAGTEGRLVSNLDAGLADDPRELWEMQRTVATEKRRGKSPVVVDLDGRVRVLDRSKIRLKETAVDPPGIVTKGP